MIRNYLKTAIRTLSRNRGYTLINIFGLLTGIAFSCMLYVYVNHELSYDQFHTKAERIFRVLTIDERDLQDVRRYAVTVPPMGPELVDNFPEVEDAVRLFRPVGQILFKIDDENFQERNWYTADGNFFEVFDFEFVEGNKSTALKEPHSLVLTETMAKKYFGDRNPIGNLIETSFGPVKVTAVLRDPPGNSHLTFDLLFSKLRTDDEWTKYLNSWESFGTYTYVVLNEGNSIANVRSKTAALAREKFAGFEGSVKVDFQAIKDIYLNSSGIEEGAESARGQRSYIYIFSTMGIFLLIIACINYVNLATSHAMTRGREIGVRKVVGARQGQLIGQFLMESFLTTAVAAVLALFVMKLLFPYFNQITGKDFDITLQTLGSYLLPLIVIGFTVAVVSGSYPAFYLAAAKPVLSLRGRGEERSSMGVRKVLVVFQFAISIVMIVSTIVVGKQLSFIRTSDVGFDKENLIVIDINNGDVRKKFRTVKNEYAAIPGVKSVAVSTRVPGEWKNIAEIYVSGEGDSTSSYFMGFDEDMLDTYNLRLKAGRYFAEHSNDSTQVLLNEAAVRALRLVEPLGARVRISDGEKVLEATVIGIIRDFNFQSLHQKVAPIVIGSWNNPFQYIDYFTIRISGDVPATMQSITRVHEMFDQRTPIEYHFLDEQIQQFYVAEQRAAMIFRMGGVLSILVACLGLLGLATYNIQRRTKELGIRKVLGASGGSLFVLLSSSLVKQVAIAFLIAAPVAWYIMREWLKAFEYKIALHVGIFLLAGIFVVLIALLTVSYRALKAVSANPVDTLRQE